MMIKGIVLMLAGFLVVPWMSKDERDPAGAGKQLFEANCAVCHETAPGKQGERVPKMGPSLHGLGKLDAGQLKDMISSRAKADGKTAMPAFRSLQAADLDALVAYLHQLK